MTENARGFAPGQLVALRFDPARQGAVLQVIPGPPEDRVLVFHDGRRESYYASQLLHVEEPATDRKAVPLPEFHARLSALQLSHPGTTSLYSLHAARVNFIPYQFRPVLKFINADRPRLLVADEVGVGKTIEAGLILRELQARRDIRSVLVMCPKPLVAQGKWQMELRRFDEEFEHLDGERLRFCLKEVDLEGEWPARYSRAILPFSLFDDKVLYGNREGRRRIPGLLDLDPAPRFDLVIVDEAHAIRNPNTRLHEGVRFFCEHAEAVVFLTATPIQLHGQDLYTLLNVLRPDLILDPASFEHLTAPNPYINQAGVLARSARPGWTEDAASALEQAAETGWGKQILRDNPQFQCVLNTLSAGEPDRAGRVALVHDIERLHTLDHIINRTRRRDIGSFTTRKPETIRVPFTAEQRTLHDRLLAVQARILQRQHGDRGIPFMLSTLRRQAASSLYGLAPLIREILMRRTDALLEADPDEADVIDSLDGANVLSDEISEVLALADSLDGADPKLAALATIVREKQSLPNNKLLLFSSFRHTLSYLEEHLSLEDVRLGVIHGSVPEEERRELRSRFALPREDPEAIDLLLSSEVGSEGLDYQFCDGLINFDLPWNPMRIEQRIGRVDRYGQKSETVVIYNLITPDTVDADIYERCLLRIGIFRAALGGSEEILGRLGDGLRSVAEDVMLSDVERQRRLEQLADNEVRTLQEQLRLEDEQGALFGITVPPDQLDRDVQDAASAWLSPSALENLVRVYLAQIGTGDSTLLGSGPRYVLRAGQADRALLLADFREFRSNRSVTHRDWERWLKGGEPHLHLTFDSRCAEEQRSLIFVTPVHPLAQQAASALMCVEPLHIALELEVSDLPSGTYPFAIYQWQTHGLRASAALQPVCTDPELQERFFDLLAAGSPVPQQTAGWPDRAAFEQIESIQYEMWSEERARHRAETLRLVSYRRESLHRSHQARIAQLEEQLKAASHPNLQRMRQAQIRAAEADFARRISELEKAESAADVVSQSVAFGYFFVR